MSRRTNSTGRAYVVPAILAVASLIGLISALIGDGIFNVISWLLLGGLLGVIAWALAKRRG
ncbi:MAG: hypothetical protein EON94_02475 [Caulobacteraceae bacterium]|nr:MAG: hypothetical protein EON94_02475 [Caulobacteraceae bacterium]